MQKLRRYRLDSSASRSLKSRQSCCLVNSKYFLLTGLVKIQAGGVLPRPRRVFYRGPASFRWHRTAVPQVRRRIQTSVVITSVTYLQKNGYNLRPQVWLLVPCRLRGLVGRDPSAHGPARFSNKSRSLLGINHFVRYIMCGVSTHRDRHPLHRLPKSLERSSGYGTHLLQWTSVVRNVYSSNDLEFIGHDMFI